MVTQLNILDEEPIDFENTLESYLKGTRQKEQQMFSGTKQYLKL